MYIIGVEAINTTCFLQIGLLIRPLEKKILYEFWTEGNLVQATLKSFDVNAFLKYKDNLQ